MAVLGLCCCAQVFSSFSEWGLLSSCSVRTSQCGGSSYYRAKLLGLQELWHMGLVAPQHVESSQIGDQTCVSCIGRWVLNHWIAREVPPK